MKLTKTFVLANLFFLQSYLIRFSVGPYPTNLQEILIGLTAVIFIFEIIKSRNFSQTLKNIWSHKIIIGLIGLTLISLGLILTGTIEISPSLSANLDLLRHLKFLFFAVILTFIFLETFNTEKQRKRGVFIAGLGAILFGIFSIIYNLTGHNVTHDLRLLGPLDAAVYLAYYFVPFFLFFSINFIKNPKNIKYLIYAIILAFLILATRSMGAIGGSFLVLLIYLVKTRKFLKTKTSKIALTIISIIIFGGIFYTKILPTFQTNYSSLDERGEIWTTAGYLLKEPKNAILGLGFGQFQNQYYKNAVVALDRNPLDFYVLQPHNIFLLFIFHYGILGLIFIGYIIFQTIKKLIKTKQPNFAIFVILYFVIHGLIDTPFFKNDLLILLIIFLEMGLISVQKQGLSKHQ